MSDISNKEVFSNEAMENKTLILEDETGRFGIQQLVIIVVKLLSMSIDTQKKERAKQIKKERY